MNPCAKCRTPVGDDAVFLKNGTYMCPVCYQKYYGTAKPEAPPKRIHISVESVIAVIVVIGVFVLGYKVYSNSVESARLAAIAEKERIEKDELREEEDRKSAALARLKFEEEHKRTLAIQDQERQERFLREKALAENAAKVKAELERVARENALRRPGGGQTEAERIAAAAAAKAAAEALALEKLRLAMDRGTDLKVQFNTITEATKELALAETRRHSHATKLQGWKSLLANAIKNRNGLAAVYSQEFQLPDNAIALDIAGWRNYSGATRSAQQSGSAVILDRTEEYRGKILKYDQYLADIVKFQGLADKSSVEMAELEANTAAAKLRLDSANARIAELRPTPEEITALAVSKGSATTKPGVKTMTLKSGKSISIKSFITMDAEIHYKDEDGKQQMIKKDDVEKIQ